MKRYVKGLGVMLLCGMSGCIHIGQNARSVKTYLLTAERNQPAAQKPLAETLQVARVRALAPFDSRNFTIRRSESVFERIYPSELLIAPVENVRNLFYRWYAESGLFVKTRQDRIHGPEYVLEVELMQLVIDASQEGDVRAVVEVNVLFRNPEEAVLCSGSYHRSMPIAAASVAEAIPGWNVGLQEIMAESELDLIEALTERNE